MRLRGRDVPAVQFAVALVAFIVVLSARPLQAAEPFGFNQVAERARQLAADSFHKPTPVPDFLANLSYDEYRDIRFDVKQSLWRERGNFQVQLIHPGLYFNQPVAINVVEGNQPRKVPFSPPAD
jgi:glucans biosynthesis protein